MDENRRTVVLTAITLSNEFLRYIFFDTDSETDSDNSDLDKGEIRRIVQFRGVQQKSSRIKCYVEITVPKFNTQQFRRNFRMSPTTFESYEARLNPVLSTGKVVISVRKQLLRTLWLLATPDSYW